MPAEKQMPINEKSTWVRNTPSDVARTERTDMTNVCRLPFKALGGGKKIWQVDMEWLGSTRHLGNPDVAIPSPANKNVHFTLPKACVRVGKNVWRMPFEVLDALTSLVAANFYTSKNGVDGLIFHKDVMRVHKTCHAHYFVKLVPCKVYREAYTSSREFWMQAMVNNARRGCIQGHTIAPEPTLFAPIWTKRRGWMCVLVSQYVHGYTLKHLGRFRLPCCGRKEVVKDDVVSAVESALSDLWTLGFSHNDVHDRNVIYNPLTKRAMLVDFETCVQIEDVCVVAFLARSGLTAVEAYRKHYKDAARRGLSALTAWCCYFLDEDQEIQNPDDECVYIMKVVMPKKMYV